MHKGTQVQKAHKTLNDQLEQNRHQYIMLLCDYVLYFSELARQVHSRSGIYAAWLSKMVPDQRLLALHRKLSLHHLPLRRCL